MKNLSLLTATSAIALLAAQPAHATYTWLVCIENVSNSFSVPAAPDPGYGIPAYLDGGSNQDSDYPYGYYWDDATTGGINHNFAGSNSQHVPDCILPDSTEYGGVTVYPRFWNGQFQMIMSDAEDDNPQLTTTIAGANARGNNPTLESDTQNAGYPANAVVPDTYWSNVLGPLIVGFWYNTSNVTVTGNFQEIDMAFVAQMLYSDKAAGPMETPQEIERIKTACPPPYLVIPGHLFRPNPKYQAGQVCD